MPLTEQTVKKIYLIVFIVLAVSGALFMVFVFFFNRGTLTVISKAPYTITVPRVRTEICADDSCSVVLAPGDYEVTLQKSGYRDITRKVTVPIGGETKEEIAFAFVPMLKIKGDESDLKLFAARQFTGEDLPAEGIFSEKNYIAYLARNPESHRQTLYTRPVKDGKAGEKTAATSFIRDLKSYFMVPSIEQRDKIALIDSTADTSTLYIIDLKAKTRDSIFTYSLINGFEWLPGGDDFIFEAREGTQLATSIYLSRAGGQPQKLTLVTSIKNIVPVSGNRLIAATTQFIAAADQLSGLEGGPVTLGESQATPDAALLGTAIVLNFVDYSPADGTAQLLKSAPDLAYPAGAKLSETQKSAYFLIDGKDYELQFSS
jgi:hypothetical protein